MMFAVLSWIISMLSGYQKAALVLCAPIAGLLVYLLLKREEQPVENGTQRAQVVPKEEEDEELQQGRDASSDTTSAHRRVKEKKTLTETGSAGATSSASEGHISRRNVGPTADANSAAFSHSANTDNTPNKRGTGEDVTKHVSGDSLTKHGKSKGTKINSTDNLAVQSGRSDESTKKKASSKITTADSLDNAAIASNNAVVETDISSTATFVSTTAPSVSHSDGTTGSDTRNSSSTFKAVTPTDFISTGTYSKDTTNKDNVTASNVGTSIAIPTKQTVSIACSNSDTIQQVDSTVCLSSTDDEASATAITLKKASSNLAPSARLSSSDKKLVSGGGDDFTVEKVVLEQLVSLQLSPAPLCPGNSVKDNVEPSISHSTSSSSSEVVCEMSEDNAVDRKADEHATSAKFSTLLTDKDHSPVIESTASKERMSCHDDDIAVAEKRAEQHASASIYSVPLPARGAAEVAVDLASSACAASPDTEMISGCDDEIAIEEVIEEQHASGLFHSAPLSDYVGNSAGVRQPASLTSKQTLIADGSNQQTTVCEAEEVVEEPVHTQSIREPVDAQSRKPVDALSSRKSADIQSIRESVDSQYIGESVVCNATDAAEAHTTAQPELVEVQQVSSSSLDDNKLESDKGEDIGCTKSTGLDDLMSLPDDDSHDVHVAANAVTSLASPYVADTASTCVNSNLPESNVKDDLSNCHNLPGAFDEANVNIAEPAMNQVAFIDVSAASADLLRFTSDVSVACDPAAKCGDFGGELNTFKELPVGVLVLPENNNTITAISALQPSNFENRANNVGTVASKFDQANNAVNIKCTLVASDSVAKEDDVISQRDVHASDLIAQQNFSFSDVSIQHVFNASNASNQHGVDTGDVSIQQDASANLEINQQAFATSDVCMQGDRDRGEMMVRDRSALSVQRDNNYLEASIQNTADFSDSHPTVVSNSTSYETVNKINDAQPSVINVTGSVENDVGMHQSAQMSALLSNGEEETVIMEHSLARQPDNKFSASSRDLAGELSRESPIQEDSATVATDVIAKEHYSESGDSCAVSGVTDVTDITVDLSVVTPAHVVFKQTAKDTNTANFKSQFVNKVVADTITDCIAINNGGDANASDTTEIGMNKRVDTTADAGDAKISENIKLIDSKVDVYFSSVDEIQAKLVNSSSSSVEGAARGIVSVDSIDTIADQQRIDDVASASSSDFSIGVISFEDNAPVADTRMTVTGNDNFPTVDGEKRNVITGQEESLGRNVIASEEIETSISLSYPSSNVDDVLHVSVTQHKQEGTPIAASDIFQCVDDMHVGEVVKTVVPEDSIAASEENNDIASVSSFDFSVGRSSLEDIVPFVTDSSPAIKASSQVSVNIENVSVNSAVCSEGAVDSHTLATQMVTEKISDSLVSSSETESSSSIDVASFSSSTEAASCSKFTGTDISSSLVEAITPSSLVETVTSANSAEAITSLRIAEVVALSSSADTVTSSSLTGVVVTPSSSLGVPSSAVEVETPSSLGEAVIFLNSTETVGSSSSVNANTSVIPGPSNLAETPVASVEAVSPSSLAKVPISSKSVEAATPSSSEAFNSKNIFLCKDDYVDSGIYMSTSISEGSISIERPADADSASNITYSVSTIEQCSLYSEQSGDMSHVSEVEPSYVQPVEGKQLEQELSVAKKHSTQALCMTATNTVHPNDQPDDHLPIITVTSEPDEGEVTCYEQPRDEYFFIEEVVIETEVELVETYDQPSTTPGVEHDYHHQPHQSVLPSSSEGWEQRYIQERIKGYTDAGVHSDDSDIAANSDIADEADFNDECEEVSSASSVAGSDNDVQEIDDTWRGSPVCQLKEYEMQSQPEVLPDEEHTKLISDSDRAYTSELAEQNEQPFLLHDSGTYDDDLLPDFSEGCWSAEVASSVEDPLYLTRLRTDDSWEHPDGASGCLSFYHPKDAGMDAATITLSPRVTSHPPPPISQSQAAASLARLFATRPLTDRDRSYEIIKRGEHFRASYTIFPPTNQTAARAVSRARSDSVSSCDSLNGVRPQSHAVDDFSDDSLS